MAHPVVHRMRRYALPAGLVAGAVALLATLPLLSGPPAVDRGAARSGATRAAALTAGEDRLAAWIRSAQQTLRTRPGDASTWAQLGSAYVQRARITGDPSFYPKAGGALKRSLELAPRDNWQAMAGSGALANARHDFDAALAWGRRAQAVPGHGASVYGVIDDALTQLGDEAGATAVVQQMLDREPGVPSFTRASYHFEQRGDVARAGDALERALTLTSDPSDVAFCRYHLGELEFGRGDAAAADKQYRLGLQARSDDASLLAGRAKAAAALGHTEEAVRDYAVVVARTPQPQFVLEYAELLQSLGRSGEAQAQLALLQAQHRLLAANGVVDDLAAAEFAADHGSASDAVRHAQAEWGRRRHVLVADALAWALHRAGRDAEALRYAQQANRSGWRNATFRHHQGMIEMALGREAEARRSLAAALEINPHFSRLHAPQARSALAALGT